MRIDRNAAVRILRANPSLFGANADNSLYPKLAWLHEGLGLAAEDVAPVVCACPNILRYCIVKLSSAAQRLRAWDRSDQIPNSMI